MVVEVGVELSRKIIRYPKMGEGCNASTKKSKADNTSC